MLLCCVNNDYQEMASLVARSLEQTGVKMLTEATPSCLRQDSGRITATWTTSKNELSSDVFDTVLMATGKFWQPVCSFIVTMYYVKL